MPKDCGYISDEDFKAAVLQGFQQQLTDHSAVVMHQLVCQWNACLNAHRDNTQSSLLL
jgi:hypothetical protein